MSWHDDVEFVNNVTPLDSVHLTKLVDNLDYLHENTAVLSDNEGSDGDILTADGSGGASWQTPTYMTNPMTSVGDLIVGSDSTGTPTRLAMGTAGQVLQVNSVGTGLEYKSSDSYTPIFLTSSGSVSIIVDSSGDAITSGTAYCIDNTTSNLSTSGNSSATLCRMIKINCSATLKFELQSNMNLLIYTDGNFLDSYYKNYVPTDSLQTLWETLNAGISANFYIFPKYTVGLTNGTITIKYTQSEIHPI